MYIIENRDIVFTSKITYIPRICSHATAMPSETLTLTLYARVSYKIAYGMENQLEDAKTPLLPAQPMWEVLPNRCTKTS